MYALTPQEDQVELTMQELRRKSSALDKYVFLQSLQVHSAQKISRSFGFVLGANLLFLRFEVLPMCRIRLRLLHTTSAVGDLSMSGAPINSPSLSIKAVGKCIAMDGI